MKYHPIANIIIEILEKNIIRYTKDLYEISHIQSETGVAEKFASVSVTTFVRSFKKELQKHFEGTLYTSTLINTLDEDIFGNKPFRLLFNPIDSFTNFSRGIQNFGVSFILQEATHEKVHNVFCVSYSFYGQDIIYSDAIGSYTKGHLIKSVTRKNSKFAVGMYNTRAIREAKFTEKFKQIQASNSIISDFHLLAKGKCDAIVYNNVPLTQALAMVLLAKNLRIYNGGVENTIISNELAGARVDVIYTNKYILEEINKV